MITATFQRLQTRMDDTGWSVLRFVNMEDGPFMAVGVVADASRLCEGMDYQIDGYWKTHPKYGRQLVFASLRQEKPMTREQVVAYLTKYATGIGIATADRIYDQFGPKAIETIRNNPEEVAKCVKRTRVEDLKRISQSLREREGREAISAELMEIFEGLRIAHTTMQACIDLWGLGAADKIRQDAFCLLHPDIPRCGFATADKVFLKLGGKPNEHRRLLRCLQHVIDTQSSGSTWLHRKTVESAFVEYIVKNGQVPVSVAVEAFPGVLDECVHRDDIIVNGDFIASYSDATREVELVKEIKRFSGRRARLIYRTPTQDSAVLNRRKFR